MNTKKLRINCFNFIGLMCLVYLSSSIKGICQDNFKPNLYIIAVGVSRYANYDKAKLKYADKDADDLICTFKKSDLFANVYPFLLKNELAKRDTIISLRKELMKTTVDDYVVLSFSGHGILDKELNFYFCTNNINLNDIKSTAVSFDEMEYLLDSIPSRKKIFLIDACYSGEVDKEEVKNMIINATSDSSVKVLDAKPFEPANGLKVYKQSTFELMKELFVDLRRRTGATVISSSSGVDVSYEKDKWKNGLFTYSVLSAFSKNSEADNNPKDGQVTVSELIAYVTKTTKNLSRGLQVPTVREENIEFNYRIW